MALMHFFFGPHYLLQALAEPHPPKNHVFIQLLSKKTYKFILVAPASVMNRNYLQRVAILQKTIQIVNLVTSTVMIQLLIV